MKKIFNKTWNWLSGKKTLSGIALHVLWGVAHSLVFDINSSVAIQGHEAIGVLTGTGFIHKGVKLFKK